VISYETFLNVFLWTRNAHKILRFMSKIIVINYLIKKCVSIPRPPRWGWVRKYFSINKYIYIYIYIDIYIYINSNVYKHMCIKIHIVYTYVNISALLHMYIYTIYIHKYLHLFFYFLNSKKKKIYTIICTKNKTTSRQQS
jgi:hypothetical protein